MRETKNRIWLKVLAPFALLVVILLLLEWYVKAKNVPAWLFVPQHTWFKALVANWGTIWPNFLITLGEILAGYCVAVPFGVLKKMVSHPLTDRGLESFMKDWEKVQNA